MKKQTEDDGEDLIHLKNSCKNLVEEEPEDEEALSLCDLPINEENHPSRKERDIPPKPIIDPLEEFNFCSWGDSLPKESEMCVADEVFFQGQILPMRHSISFDSGMITGRTTSRCLSRSESMGHFSYSAGVSSRSSSINSHHSSSSGSSSATTVPMYQPRSKVPNQFRFSHPSPKPQIRSSNIKNNRGHMGINPNRKSTFWSFLRAGLVTTPEIAMQDLKFRSKSNNSTKNFGSRNSTSSISSTFSNAIKESDRKQQQQQHKFFDKNRVFFSSCKCSPNGVVGPIPSRVPINVITRSASSNGEPHAVLYEHEEDNSATEKHNRMRTTKHRQAGKQSLSRHRTFEWLKQLSLEAAVAVIDESQ